MDYCSSLVLLLFLFPLMRTQNVNTSVMMPSEPRSTPEKNISDPGGLETTSAIPDSNVPTPRTDQGSSKSDDIFGVMLQFEKIFADEKAKLFIPRSQTSINQFLLALGKQRFGQCFSDLISVLESVKRREEWALDMIDAIGKPGPRFRQGSNMFPGDFDLCLDAKTGLDFETHFCGATIGILGVKNITLVKPTGFLIGMCLPSSCHVEQIKDVINVYMYFNQDINGGAVDVICRERDPSLSSKGIMAVCICSLFLGLILVGTAYDVFYKIVPLLVMEGNNCNGLDQSVTSGSTLSTSGKRYLETQPIIDHEKNAQPIYTVNNADSAHYPKEKCRPVEILKQVLISFSAYTNFSNLVSTDQPQGSITCIDGLRVISLNWIIILHFIATKGLGIDNYHDYLEKSYERWRFMIALASTVAVDTFFAIAGFLVSYLTLKQLAKKEDGLTPKFFGHFYIHRLWRITPTYMLILMTYVMLFQYVYTGPGWKDEGFEKNHCSKTWWTNLLYINNFVHDDEMCMEWSWYLSNDMQFYIISPLLCLPLFYYEWRGLVVPLAFLLGNAICTGVITSVNDLPAYAKFIEVPEAFNDVFWVDYYIKPYTRIGPYIVGTITGFLLYKCQRKAYIPKLLVVLGWVVATTLALVVIFGLSEHQTDDPLSADVAGLFNSLNRIAWGMSICWVIFACANGYGGIANTILSWKAFVPLSKLTFCVYLIHPIVVQFFYMSQRRLYYMTDVNYMFGIISVTVLAYAIGIIAYLMFEAPMAKLEKVVKANIKGTNTK